MDPRHRLTDLGPCQQLLTSVSLSHAAWDVQILCRSLVAHVPATLRAPARTGPTGRPAVRRSCPRSSAHVRSITMGFNFDI